MTTIINLKWPFQAEAGSNPATTDSLESVGESLRRILLTQRSELVMAPNYGSDILKYVFENLDPMLTEYLKADIQAAIAQFEPRAIIRRMIPTQIDSTISIEIQYVLKTTGQIGTITVDSGI